MQALKEFDKNDLMEFEPEGKVGILATINHQGEPHLTLITALQAKSTNQLMFGQFSEGESKKNVKSNPNTGFLIMNFQKQLWRGKAKWTHEMQTGEDFEMYNNKPMFRYNSYFGIHTVHYMDLVETYPKQSLPMTNIVIGAFKTMMFKFLAKSKDKTRILKPWAQGLFNQMGALKFLSFIDDNGYPAIIPIIQCQAADSRTLAFAPSAFKDDLKHLTPNTIVAVFGMSMKLEDVLIRGGFKGFQRKMGVKLGIIDIQWVYNSMPPKPQQIYPEIPFNPVSSF
jgi:hypothetical protein